MSDIRDFADIIRPGTTTDVDPVGALDPDQFPASGKKRGWPKGKARKPRLASDAFVDPTSAQPEEGGGALAAKAKGASPKFTFNVSGWAGILEAAHKILAIKVPEMALDEDEAMQLAKATAPIMKRHNINPIPEWAGEYVLLAATLKVIYGPRLAAIAVRKATLKKPKPATPSPPLTPEQQAAHNNANYDPGGGFGLS